MKQQALKPLGGGGEEQAHILAHTISLIPCRLSGQVEKETVAPARSPKPALSSFLGWPGGGQHKEKAQPILGS